MSAEADLRLSYYTHLGYLNAAHGVRLIQDKQTHQVYVLKTLTVYDIQVMRYLMKHPLPGIPLIHELIQDGPRLLVVEEYISGPSLREVLKSGTLPEYTVRDLLCKLCRILIPLHKQKPPIVHRDIKPSNLILARGNRLFLVDFNAAKKSSEAVRDTVLIGTQGYAAPEQYGFASSQPSADIYAMGVLMNELITGSPELCYEGPLSPILQKCTKMDPSQRYQNAEELLWDLNRVRDLPAGSYYGLSEEEDDAEEEAYPEGGAADRPRESHRPPFRLILQGLCPPGFRSRNPVRMMLAGMWYALIAILAISSDFGDYPPSAAFLAHWVVFAVFLLPTLWFGNYLHVWDYFAWSSDSRPVRRFFGILALGLLIMAASFLIGILLISLTL